MSTEPSTRSDAVPPGPVVVLACDKFKGSLSAVQVSKALEAGILEVWPGAEIRAVPVADGGDGTLAAAVAAGFTLEALTATGPTGSPVATHYAHRDGTALIEMASVSGLALLPGDRPAPLTATSRGTGEVVASALRSGFRDIVLGIGGSASTDGGAGLVRALGAEVLDADGEPVGDGGLALTSATRLDVRGLRRMLDGARVTVACDVDNPLTGPSGAAAVYGPQKGATPEQIVTLDHGLATWADLVAGEIGVDLRDRPGAGAAGGVGFAAIALLGAEMRPGIDFLLDLVGYDAQLDGAALVVTGEGSLDEQTLSGKAAAGVARRASGAGVPSVAVCGRNELDATQEASMGVADVFALADLEPDADRSMTNAAALLTKVGRRIAETHLTDGRPD
ncbi:MAG: glycerate kinase [Nocardioides sp.]